MVAFALCLILFLFPPCGGRASVDPVCEQHGQAQEAQFRRVPGTYCLHAQGSALDSCMTNSRATPNGSSGAVVTTCNFCRSSASSASLTPTTADKLTTRFFAHPTVMLSRAFEASFIKVLHNRSWRKPSVRWATSSAVIRSSCSSTWFVLSQHFVRVLNRNPSRLPTFVCQQVDEDDSGSIG